MLAQTFLAALPLLGAAAAAPALAQRASTSQTLQPDMIVQLEGDNGSYGTTTSPNIQRKNSLFGIEASFSVPAALLTPNATCSLAMELNGLNSQSSWVGYAPDGTSVADVVLLNGSVAASDTWNTYAAAQGPAWSSALNLTMLPGDSGVVTFTPSILPCAATVGLRIVPGSEDIILGWEQDPSLPEGLVLVVQS